MKKRLLYVACIFSVHAASAMKTKEAPVEEAPTLVGMANLIDEKWGNLPAGRQNVIEEQERLAQVKLYVARGCEKRRQEVAYELLNGPSKAQGTDRIFVLQKAIADYEDSKLWVQLIGLGADASIANSFGETFAEQADQREPVYAEAVRLQAVRNQISDILLQVECWVQTYEAALQLTTLCRNLNLVKDDVFRVIDDLAILKGKESDALTKLSQDFEALISGGRPSAAATADRLVHLQAKLKDLEKAAEQKQTVLTIPQVAGIAAATGLVCFVIAKLTSGSSN